MTYEQTAVALEAAQRTERRDLKKRACFVGVSLLCGLAIELLLAFWISPLLDTAERNMNASVVHRLFYYVLDSGYYCVMLLLPVALPALLFRQKPLLPRTMRRRIAPLEGLLLVLCGLSVCILANYLTNYWLMFVQLFGVQPYTGDYHTTAGALPFLLNLFTYALLPAVVEELVYRGWFLAALQPGGERCALVLSAFLFGLVHGNLTQLPFAFLLGLLFGWLYLTTGHLWPGMVLHFLNNALSVVLDQAAIYLADAEYLVLQTVLFAALVIVGLVAGVLLAVHPAFAATVRPLTDRRSALLPRQRAGLMWGNPAVIVSIVVYVVLTMLAEVAR